MPFSRFSGVDIVFGPEMKSTGEVMGIASTFGEAFAKSQMSANPALPRSGKIFISVKDEDKRNVVLGKKAGGYEADHCCYCRTAQLKWGRRRDRG